MMKGPRLVMSAEKPVVRLPRGWGQGEGRVRRVHGGVVQLHPFSQPLLCMLEALELLVYWLGRWFTHR